jgi:hypothetical protein
MPLERAGLDPRFAGWRINRTPRPAYSAATAAERSREASSTTITSKSAACCARQLSIARRTSRSRL